jgi:hypothetical protein
MSCLMVSDHVHGAARGLELQDPEDYLAHEQHTLLRLIIWVNCRCK